MRWRWVLGWFFGLAISVGHAQIQQWSLDPAHSQFDFEIQPRFGQVIRGTFPKFEGVVQRDLDGNESVLIRLFTQNVDIQGKPYMTEHVRGASFFDANQFPIIEFHSTPHSTSVLSSGGTISGTLTIRNITHQVTFQVLQAQCANPGHGCDVSATGNILRTDYGMGHWLFLLDDQVTFSWRGRVIE